MSCGLSPELDLELESKSRVCMFDNSLVLSLSICLTNSYSGAGTSYSSKRRGSITKVPSFVCACRAVCVSRFRLRWKVEGRLMLGVL